jgi:prepilin-type processing-associated H-X9-DG protein
MSEVSPSRLSPAAVLAFVLGASSVLLSLATALPALFVGVYAVRAINRADGRLHGQRLAIAGLLLGAFVTLATLAGIGALVLLRLQESSLEIGCKNNLRQVGQAVQAYDIDNKHFPPGTLLNSKLTPEQRLSWEAALIRYLPPPRRGDKKWEKLGGEMDDKEAWDAAANAGLRRNVAPYLCPAFARDFTAGRMGLTSYAGIAGVGGQAALLPLDDANAGFFGYDRVLRSGDISASLSALMVSVETRQDNGPWAAGGTPTVRGLEPDCQRYIGNDAAFGGLHRNGANVLWADGSVHVVGAQIDPQVFRLEARISRP